MLNPAQFVKYSWNSLKHESDLRNYFRNIITEYFDDSQWSSINRLIIYNEKKANALYRWMRDQKERLEDKDDEHLTHETFNLITHFFMYISAYTDIHNYADTLSYVGDLSHAFVGTEYAWHAAQKDKGKERLLELAELLEIKSVSKKRYYKWKAKKKL